MRQPICLVINPITVDDFASGVRLYDGTWISVGWYLLLQISSGVVRQSFDLQLSRNTLYLLCPRLCFFLVLNRDLYVYRDDSLTS